MEFSVGIKTLDHLVTFFDHKSLKYKNMEIIKLII